MIRIKEQIELRIHGRGGAGGKSAGQLIAETALEHGKYVQAFAEYGPERSGAPTKVYVRLSNTRIRTHEPVINPNTVLVLDQTLIKSANVTEGLDAKGILIVNTNKGADYIKKQTKFKGKIYVVDATKIAIELFGKNIPNTVMLGALIKVSKIINLELLNKKIKEHFLEKLGKEKTNANIAAVKKGYNEVK